jgi:hypothetical protein
MTSTIPRINIDEARTELAKLNSLLQEKCEDLSFTIDYYSDMKEQGMTDISVFKEEYFEENDTAVLCLNYDNKCISSLILNIAAEIPGDDDEIEITSKTNSIYEGRKFNKLLRAVIIIIGGFIKSPNGTHIGFIFSKAENPISAYLMINTFNAIPLTEEGRIMIDFLKIKKEDGKVPLDTIKQHMDNPKTAINTAIKTRIRITEDNIKLATEVFHSVLNSKWFQSIDKKCMSMSSPTSGGNKTKKRKTPRKLKTSRKCM